LKGEVLGRRLLTGARHSRGSFAEQEIFVIILGVILLIIGFVTGIAILWTIGIILLVIGLILALLGTMGRAVGGRRHYW
jgi:membrane-bound ClpP family serine protease